MLLKLHTPSGKIVVLGSEQILRAYGEDGGPTRVVMTGGLVQDVRETPNEIYIAQDNAHPLRYILGQIHDRLMR